MVILQKINTKLLKALSKQEEKEKKKCMESLIVCFLKLSNIEKKNLRLQIKKFDFNFLYIYDY